MSSQPQVFFFERSNISRLFRGESIAALENLKKLGEDSVCSSLEQRMALNAGISAVNSVDSAD